jgi:hypothetical protein
MFTKLVTLNYIHLSIEVLLLEHSTEALSAAGVISLSRGPSETPTVSDGSILFNVYS